MNHKKFNQILWSVVGIIVLQAATDADGDGIFGPRDPVELLQFDPATDREPRRVASPEALASAGALLN